MGCHRQFFATLALVLVAWSIPRPVPAQLLEYPEPVLDYIYPAGGQAGQTVEIELGAISGLAGATGVIVDGPPGVTVAEVKPVNYAEVRAKLAIAPDAAPGRRMVRVVGAANGLTNFRTFVVGRLPEVIEQEGNNTPEAPNEVTTPVVVNGRIDPTLDIDCFRFAGQAGQQITVAIQAHAIDSKVRPGFTLGFLDASLELLDANGGVVAAAEDTLGLDPVLRVALPADGVYVVRVASLAYKGAHGAVYRLTIGDVPYLAGVFPPGAQRGQSVEVELIGPGIPPGARQTVTVPADERFPYQSVTLDDSRAGPADAPFLRGDFLEIVEAEPNNDSTTATAFGPSMTANGRFAAPADEDWYRLTLAKDAGVIISTQAQRVLRSPVDTVIEVYDATGVKRTENDDGRLFMGQVWHDFEPADSRLAFTPPADGDYFVRVRDGAGAASPLAVYRLTVEPLRPDFAVFQWPDAVPIWGVGGTASFVAQVFTWGGLNTDVELRVEGLPPGWSAGNSVAAAAFCAQYHDTQIGAQPLVTITAPPDAPLGTVVPFRVIGRAEQDGRVIEHEAQYLTLYGSSHNDRMFLRVSPGPRAVVAPPLDCLLSTSVTELTVAHGGTVDVPVKVQRFPDKTGPIAIGIDGLTVAARCGLRPPVPLAPEQTELSLPLTVSTELKPGVYPIVVSRAWAADLRGGRPGPCTPLIRLQILPP
jgi:hypothetical protein